jgi:hypothetical protein
MEDIAGRILNKCLGKNIIIDKKSRNNANPPEWIQKKMKDTAMYMFKKPYSDLSDKQKVEVIAELEWNLSNE